VNTDHEIVVVGSGVAGSAIAHTLATSGRNVTLVFDSPIEGSSFSNQKWNHSGLLYPAEAIARLACDAFHNESLLRKFTRTTPPTRFIALNKDTIEDRSQWWSEWGVREWGLNWRELRAEEVSKIGKLRTNAVGGFETPDCIVDFPRLIQFLREGVIQSGGRILSGARAVKLETTLDKVTGVLITTASGTQNIKCSTCILATGAWTNSLLDRSGIKQADLILRKCVVFHYAGELVDSITTCLDVLRHDGEKQDVTMVPFDGVTIAAGTGFTQVETGEDQSADSSEVNRLYDQLIQAFPDLIGMKYEIKTCIKTEKSPGGKPNVKPQIFGKDYHGIQNLLVTIPGKASFMFDLARDVSKSVG
jgi:glycine/D-amino acid oxidase-like deaminating enzyme